MKSTSAAVSDTRPASAARLAKNSPTPVPARASSGWMPAGGLYYVHPVNDRLRLGISMNGYFGLSLDYEDDWVGRYYVQDTTLQAAAVQPAGPFVFGLNEVRIGLPIPEVVAAILARQAGPRVAEEMCVSGRLVKTPSSDCPTFAFKARMPPTSTVISGAVSVSSWARSTSRSSALTAYFFFW